MAVCLNIVPYLLPLEDLKKSKTFLIIKWHRGTYTEGVHINCQRLGTVG